MHMGLIGKVTIGRLQIIWSGMLSLMNIFAMGHVYTQQLCKKSESSCSIICT